MRAMYLVPVLSLLAACGPAADSDLDEDGLSFIDEIEAGTDPDEPDSDGDGLFDGDEIDFGSDPLEADSDGDGLNDGDEKAYGLNPNVKDADYAGGWPRQTVAVKTAVEDARGSGRNVDIRKRFPRAIMKDQFREDVDLYDFAGHGKKIMIDVSAEWCPPCQQLAQLVEPDGPSTGDAAFDAILEDIRTAIVDEDIYWITILSEDNSNKAPAPRVAVDWNDSYPNEHVPVFADKDQEFLDYVVAATNGWPTLVVLNENMTVLEFGAGVDPTIMERVLD